MPFGRPLELPDAPAGQRASALVELRYEDVMQSGHVRPEALAHGMGLCCWRELLLRTPLREAARSQGLLAILTRIEVSLGGGPVAVGEPLRAAGGYRLGHRLDERGEPERVLLELFARLEGPRGRTHGPPPDDAGRPVEVGRIRAEHVFTRPFAPPEARRVRRLPPETGLPPVPGEPWRWRPASASGQLPEGAAPLEEAARPHPAPLVFGVGDTDSNQHVNSLVYPRRFEAAALLRLHELGRGGPLRPVALEVAFRKPCFAGERVRLQLQAFELEGRPGVAGAFLGEDDARPRAFARMLFASS